MIAELEGGGRALHDLGEPRLSLEQRLEREILAIEVEKVEGEINKPGALAPSVAACMRLNDVVPSARTAQSSSSR